VAGVFEIPRQLFGADNLIALETYCVSIVRHSN
jgi:hypothetical protein